MHTATYRMNAVLTMAFSGLIVLCFAVALTEIFFHSDPSVDLRLNNVHYFKQHRRNDEMVLSFNMKSDLSSCFGWNTKQLFAYIKIVYETKKHGRNEVIVWDTIIRSREEAGIDDTFMSKYKLVDNGADLRGRNVNVTLAWNVMPYIGKSRF
mmetsp:Transcript_8619/g.15950  ORF Transcript_8619/g.15950 Transcript_8619/m.15950 type:complete len:152 (+) Transcript_8619:131-586(+)